MSAERVRAGKSRMHGRYFKEGMLDPSLNVAILIFLTSPQEDILWKTLRAGAKSLLHTWGRRQTGQFRRFRNFAVAQRMQHFQDFAPSREGPTIGTLVLIHGLHEQNFFIAIVFLAGSGINLTASFAFFTPILAAASFDVDSNRMFATFTLVPTIAVTPIRNYELWGQVALVAHKSLYLIVSPAVLCQTFPEKAGVNRRYVEKIGRLFQI